MADPSDWPVARISCKLRECEKWQALSPQRRGILLDAIMSNACKTGHTIYLPVPHWRVTCNALGAAFNCAPTTGDKLLERGKELDLLEVIWPRGRPGIAVNCSHITILPEENEQKRTIRPKTRFRVMKRDDWTCGYCNRHKDQLNDDEWLEIDHIEPESRGGSSDLDNLRTACVTCNRGKFTETVRK